MLQQFSSYFTLNMLGLTGVVMSAAIQQAESEKLEVTESQFSQWERKTYMGDADTTVDGESRGQVLVEAVEPRPVHFIHQLGHPDHLWKKEDLKKG